MARYTKQNVNSVPGINAELTKIQTAINDTLSRKGDVPNQMEATLDMNSERIINLPDPVSDREPLTFGVGRQILEDATAQADRAEQEADRAEQEADRAQEAADLALQYPDGQLASALADVNSNVLVGGQPAKAVGKATKAVGNSTHAVMWNPGPQPPARVDREGWFFNAFEGTAEQAITQLWEPLRALDPSYITRENLGKDTSGVYDVWRYTFTPPSYDRTLIINGCLHGSEVTGMLALYLMLKEMVENWENQPQLAHLRWRTRLVIIPISNPWGFSQTPVKNRLNVNNVNLNRNFDYRWSEYVGTDSSGQDYKGTAPFSEKETQYVRDTLALYPDAIAFIDLHNFGGLGEKFPVFLVPEFADSSDIVMDVVAKLRQGDDDIGVTRTYNPYAMAYAAKEYGMHSVTIEFSDGAYGDSAYSPIAMTKAVEWFGNLILAFSRAPSKATAVNYLSPYCIFASWSKSLGTQTVSSDVYTEIQPFRVTMPINQPGYVKITGYVIGTCNTNNAVLFISPQFGQVGYGKWGANDNIPGGFQAPGNERTAEFEAYADVKAATTDRVQLNFVAALPVYPTGPNLTNLFVGLRARITNGATFDFNRYRCMIEFVPSGMGDQRCTMQSSVGRESEGINAMVQTYPKN